MRITAVSLARFAEARLAGGNRSPDTPGHARTRSNRRLRPHQRRRRPRRHLAVVRERLQHLLGPRRRVDRQQDHGLPAGVDRRMEGALRDPDRLPRADREGRPVVDHLVAGPREHVEDLVGVRVVVALVALAGEQHHVHKRDARIGDVVVGHERLDDAPVERVRRQLGGIDQLRWHHTSPQALAASALKRRMFSVIATSVGSRSIDDAPKKPTIPSVRSSTYWASSGSASGPPWQSTITSSRTRMAASRMAWISAAQSSSVFAVTAPIVPFVVRPMCGTSTSAPASVMATALSGSNTYGAVNRPSDDASRIMSTSRP